MMGYFRLHLGGIFSYAVNVNTALACQAWNDCLGSGVRQVFDYPV